MKRYIVTFVPTLKDCEALRRTLDLLAREDPTFSYSERLNFFSFEDDDKNRAFRRGMWIKRALAQSGIELGFVFSKFKVGWRR
jgi:hypothetical protein